MTHIGLRLLVSGVAVIAITARYVFSVEIDGITVGLLCLVFLQWLGPLITRVEIPGVGKSCIQSIITNWFIAFGGFAQRPEFGGGDLGFGSFHSAGQAIQASQWADHHLEWLKNTNLLLRQEKPHAGFRIVQDEILPGFMQQVRSDWLSKFAKAWKREGERIADNARRYGRPIVAIHSDIFSGMQDVRPEWLGGNEVLDGFQDQFIRPDAISRLPWKL